MSLSGVMLFGIPILQHRYPLTKSGEKVPEIKTNFPPAEPTKLDEKVEVPEIKTDESRVVLG